jgi:hypothetical protein
MRNRIASKKWWKYELEEVEASVANGHRSDSGNTLKLGGQLFIPGGARADTMNENHHMWRILIAKGMRACIAKQQVLNCLANDWVLKRVQGRSVIGKLFAVGDTFCARNYRSQQGGELAARTAIFGHFTRPYKRCEGCRA